MATKKKDGKTKTGSGASLKLVRTPPESGGIDFESVRMLARIAAEFDLAEVAADRDGHIRVRRGSELVAGPTALPTPAGRPIALTGPPPAETGAAEAGVFISSPFVGTFYRAPSPEAATFVEVGAKVRKGQVVCIVEAMKLMNEIEAEADGKIEEILVKNGEHVEYGQHLFRLSRV
jgi:acetyl-CoA carboxylase biotin carboxyl carrier protein